MDNQENIYMNKFYTLLLENLVRTKSLKANSILISFLQMPSAARYNHLKNSTLQAYLIPENVSGALLEKGLIQCIEKLETFAITAKGVWNWEKTNGQISEQILLTYINEKYFVPSIKKNLGEKEKVILMTMLSARTFSEKSSVDLKKSDAIKDRWQEVLLKTYDFLFSLGVIKDSRESFLDNTGNMHPVSSLFRHNTKMLQKTFGYYKYNRKEEYYLDLGEDSNLTMEKLSYLFYKVFEGNLSQETVDLIANYCNEISNKESIYLFDMNLNNHVFSLPKYDFLIKDAILDSFVHRQKWAKIS
jgi:hypothetical protein